MINITCACGNTMSVDDRFAGRSAQCPNCRAMVQIPAPVAPASPFPTPQPAWGPAIPGLYQQNPAGYYPQPGQPQQKAKYPGKIGVIFVSLLLLLTAVVPWVVSDGVFTWSWDMLGDAGNSQMAFIIGSWTIAILLIVLACVLRGLPFSIPLTLLAAGGAALMGLAWEQCSTTLQTVTAAFNIGAIADEPVMLAAAICLLAMLMVTSIRVRIGGNIVVRILQGLTAAGFITLALIDYIPGTRDFVEKLINLDPSSLAENGVLQPIIIEGAMRLAVLLTLIGGLLAFIHAVAIPIKGAGLSKAAGVLARMGVALLEADIIAAPGLAGASTSILPTAISLILLVSIPVLLGMGVVRLVSDIVLALRPKTAQL